MNTGGSKLVVNDKLNSREVDSVLERFNIDPKIPIISQIGRFDPWKGIDTVIDVYRQVKSVVYHFEF